MATQKKRVKKVSSSKRDNTVTLVATIREKSIEVHAYGPKGHFSGVTNFSRRKEPTQTIHDLMALVSASIGKPEGLD
jgi:hypothetical protein